MKKALSFVLALVMLMSVLSLTAFAEEVKSNCSSTMKENSKSLW